jgi:hypothetical protein
MRHIAPWLVALLLLTLASVTHADEPVPFSVAEASAILFVDDPDALTAATASCDSALEPGALVRCLLEQRFGGDARARKLALRLYDGQGTLVGLEEADTRKVGYRGMVTFVPTLPVGKDGRKHLKWIVEGLEDIDKVLTALEDKRGAAIPYRWKALAMTFTSTPGRRTPSAYAWKWEVTYNLRGSLHRSGRAVRQTLFHELFHLNDQHHRDWADNALGPIFDGIVARCTGRGGKLSTPCLKPFAPGKTKVRKSTYYAFHPGNGVGEYAAELALRFFIEQRAMVLGQKLPGKPFKCGPEENARAWKLLIDEFYGGVDWVPACGE